MIMRRSKYAETVVNTMTRDDDQTPSGRGDSDYYLKMPHVRERVIYNDKFKIAILFCQS